MKVSTIIPVKGISKYIRGAIPYILDLDYEIIILPDPYKQKKKYLDLDKIRIIETGKPARQKGAILE